MVSNKPFSQSAAMVSPSLGLAPDELSKEAQLIDFIRETSEDLRELDDFYNITFSPTRIQRIGEYIAQRANEVAVRFIPGFETMSQQGKIDYLLMHCFVQRQIARLRTEWDKTEELEPLFADWAYALVELCEKRQKVVAVNGKDAAQTLANACIITDRLLHRIRCGDFVLNHNKFAAYRGAQCVEELSTHLDEWYAFFNGYDPLFSWWTSKPWQDLKPKLADLANLLRQKLIGIAPGDQDAIVGQPIGRKNILVEIGAELLPYSPEQLIELAEREYQWCEQEAIKASEAMGFGKDWRKAQDHVKDTYVEPGQQIHLVHQLAQEAVDYVEKHDMVTLPDIAKECWRTSMMAPKDQKVNPFFLGGPKIIVSYPTDTMSHEEKLMVMRGNNPAFSRSTVFHELLPGHHLQYHYMRRSKPHRQLFSTPFWMEGWAFYWEKILWDRGFPGTPENKLGMLFWYMHRCARIVFSLKFHLGEWTPQECIDYLVTKVNHERATAEGEVRRSFNGDWGALYQAGYMLGALQIYALRKEMVDGGSMTEKEFHDRVMRENSMQIELLRALLKNQKLSPSLSSTWKFYGDLEPREELVSME